VFSVRYLNRNNGAGFVIHLKKKNNNNNNIQTEDIYIAAAYVISGPSCLSVIVKRVPGCVPLTVNSSGPYPGPGADKIQEC